jgi:hypothetical protein
MQPAGLVSGITAMMHHLLFSSSIFLKFLQNPSPGTAQTPFTPLNQIVV